MDSFSGIFTFPSSQWKSTLKGKNSLSYGDYSSFILCSLDAENYFEIIQ